MTKEFFNIWLKDNFFKESIYKNVKGNVIIFDRATSHYDQDNIELFKMNESNFILIPAGQTRFVQPLDVGVNKVFKDSIYKKYNEFKLSTLCKSIITVDKVISWISEVWWDNSCITKECIYNSFKKCGLLNSIENTNIDNIEIPNELLINNSIVENDDEIIKKYNVNLADDKKNQTLDKFLINLNTSSTIDTFSLTNNMTNNEELEDLSDFGESDFSSEDEDDEEDNIFSTNEFITGK